MALVINGIGSTKEGELRIDNFSSINQYTGRIEREQASLGILSGDGWRGRGGDERTQRNLRKRSHVRDKYSRTVLTQKGTE